LTTIKAGHLRWRGDADSHVAAVHAGSALDPLLRISLYSLRHYWQAGLAIGATIIASILQLTIPRLLGAAIDQAQNVLSVTAEGAEAALWGTALTLLAVSLARGFFTLVQNYFSEAVGHHVGYELRLAFYDKVQKLPYAYHDRVHSGDLITLGLLDLDGLRIFSQPGLCGLCCCRC
jgi:ATP-binding cassette subfamily B multidrug efflux pump